MNEIYSYERWYRMNNDELICFIIAELSLYMKVLPHYQHRNTRINP